MTEPRLTPMSATENSTSEAVTDTVARKKVGTTASRVAGTR